MTDPSAVSIPSLFIIPRTPSPTKGMLRDPPLLTRDYQCLLAPHRTPNYDNNPPPLGFPPSLILRSKNTDLESGMSAAAAFLVS